MLALLSVTVVAGARFNVTEPIRGLLMGGTNLWVSCGWGGLVRFILCHCCPMASFPFLTFPRDSVEQQQKNMKCCQLSCYNKWLHPITPSVSADFRRTAVNKKWCLANNHSYKNLAIYANLLHLVAPIRPPQAMRGPRRTKCYIFIFFWGGGGSFGIDSVLLTEGSTMDSETML